MDAKLVEFSNLLRQNGLRVSLAESMDMLRALAETLSRVGNGPREWRPMKVASVVPRPAKPARQTFRNRLRSPATPSLQSAPTNCFAAPAPPTFAAPALPAAARHSHY